jgi:hypothetical protein
MENHMKNKILSLLIIAGVLYMSGSVVLAQEKKDVVLVKEQKAEEEVKKIEEDKKILEAIKEIYKRLNISVKIYMDWWMHWGHNSNSFDHVTKYEINPSETKTKNNNEFRVNRALIDVNYKISDIFNARLTTDADLTVTPTGASNAAFHIFLKYAYIEAKKDFGPVALSAAGGMIDTPIIGWIDKLSDLRWVSQNYIDNSKAVLNNLTIDNSGDLGVKASIDLFKYVTLTGAFTNGTGYKANENNSYKAVSYLATISPYKGIYLNGYGRNNIDNKYDYTGKKARTEFYGYGAAYTSDLIKIGFNHVFAYATTVGLTSAFGSVFTIPSTDVYLYPVLRRGYQLVDSWLNFYLGALVPDAPIILVGRVAYGFQARTHQRSLSNIDFDKERKTVLYLLGIGWRFNKNFRILVGGELQRYIVTKNKTLRLLQGNSGTEFFNGGALDPALANVYVGSKNPNDAKRIYVKAEVTF